MARRGTRRSKAKGVLSIPALRQSFEHMESMAVSLAASVASKKMSRAAASSAYAKEWKRVFHRDLPSKSAEAAIDFSLTVPASKKGLRRRTMRGGQAPIDWDTVPVQTAPAVPGQVTASGYAPPPNVLPYITGGFGVGVPADSLSTGCASGVNPYPAPYPGLGTNAFSPPGSAGANSISASTFKGGRRKGLRSRKQRGGAAALSDAFNGFLARPAQSESPTTFLQDMRTSWDGQTPAASPSPVDPAFAYKFDSSSASALKLASEIQRNMTQDISSPPPRSP